MSTSNIDQLQKAPQGIGRGMLGLAPLQAHEIVNMTSSYYLQASEEELFSLFSPIGEILELYILRNSNGKSRGCAFVTYANKYLAQQAITQLNGKQVCSKTSPKSVTVPASCAT